MATKTTSGKLGEIGAGRFKRVFKVFKFLDSEIHLSLFLGCLFVMGLVVLMVRTEPSDSGVPVYKAGEIAEITVRAEKALEISDPEAIQTEKSVYLSSIPPVYDLDTEAVSAWIDRWQVAIRLLRSKARAEKSASRKVLEDKLGVSISETEYSALLRVGFSSDLERSISFAMGPLWDLRIIENRNLGTSAIELVDLRSSKTLLLKSSEFSYLLTLEEARALVGRAARTKSRTQSDKYRMPWASWETSTREIIFGIQSRLVRPNVTLNRRETENRRDQILKDFKPTQTRIEKGEVIVREGEKVSRKAALILEELSKNLKSRQNWGRLPFEILLGALFLWFVLVFLKRLLPRALFKSKDLIVAGTGLVTSVAALKLCLIFQINVVADYFTRLPPEFFIFLIPVAAPAMILRLLIKTPLAALVSVVFGISISVMMGDAALLGIHVTITSLMAAHFLRASRTRSDLHMAGLKTAGVTGLSALLVMISAGGNFSENAGLFRIEQGAHLVLWTKLGWAFLGGALSGWVASAIALILTPLLENILDYTTDLKLLELARMDHPLLRDLVLKAPGTYHHSIIVGSLAEAACESVGANALLARVGAYYHDIGKMGRPEYFVENQGQSGSLHEEVSPQLSAKIIISHVKEGKILAENYRLGQDLIDFIEQHHGTSLVGFFYHKAQQEAAKPNSKIKPEEVREEDFRYPGPKPQSKEAAIMALADSCEAATRSLVEPTPARIEGMVEKIINKAYSEGLLDEADITLREVHMAGRAFLRILLGIHHNRIQYPDQEKGLPQTSNLSLVKSSQIRS